MLTFSRDVSESNGDMPKSWNKNHTILYKCSVPVVPRYYEIDSEWLCCRFADKLGIECVKYNLCNIEAMYLNKQQKLQTVACQTFYSEQEMFVTPMKLAQNMSVKDAVNKIASVDRRKFTQMVLFDFLIANDDRHLRNFGIINSAKGVRFAPLFDNDKALFSHEANDNSSVFGTFNRWTRSKVGLYDMLYDGVVEELKLCKHSRMLVNIENFKKNLTKIVYELPTDMSEIRRDNIIKQVQLRLQILEGLM